LGGVLVFIGIAFGVAVFLGFFFSLGRELLPFPIVVASNHKGVVIKEIQSNPFRILAYYQFPDKTRKAVPIQRKAR
jgi:hypothetical protein